MNPFSMKYHPDFFCDREQELQLLTDNALNGRNTLIHSPRRLGKSALILHLFHQMEKEKRFETLYVDLFAAANLHDLIREFGEALLRKYYVKNLLEGVRNLFSGIQATISFSPDGSPKLGISTVEGQGSTDLAGLFDFLENRKKPVIVAFDEFQEIADFPEKAEALLRSFAQQLNNVSFIYSGSSNHVLRDMFFGTRQPFFQSADSMVLDKIATADYAAFIGHCFRTGKKKITPDAVDYLLDFSEGHTYYTQLICNESYYKSAHALNRDEAYGIANNYLETRKADYAGILNLLPENQKKVIKAIAREGRVQQPTSIDFLIRHNLPSTSSTLQAVKALEEKEMIYKTANGYKVYDVFFRRFLEKYF